MSDLVVTSRPLLTEILTEVEPYVIFKKRHVTEALRLLPLIRPRLNPEGFLEVAHQIDAFASLNYSKSKRISAVDVEQHLRSKGLLAPVSTASLAKRRDGSLNVERQIHDSHNTPAPGNRVKV